MKISGKEMVGYFALRDCMILRCNTKLIKWLLINFLGLLSILANASSTVDLVTGERVPYIGNYLYNKGYVYQLVEEAFARSGYNVRISFHPWARSNDYILKGKADGILPVYQDAFPDDEFLFSDPFPGDTIGLLKRIDNPFKFKASPLLDLSKALSSDSELKVGSVRGGSLLPDLEGLYNITLEFVTREVQNLDKLENNRIHFVLIDKYTAADLMVEQRPHLIGKLEFLEPPLATKNFHIVFNKKSKHAEESLRAFNRGLAELKQQGRVKEILIQHGLLAEAKQPDNKIKLTIGTVNNPDMVIMQALSTEFEQQNPSISLEWYVLEENTLRRRLLSDLAIHNGQFDIMTIGTYETPIWANSGWISPLENLSQEYELDDVLPSITKALTYKDKLYALPFYAESIMTYYRKDLLEKAGLKMPETPTYGDIQKFAARLHQPDQGIYGICLRGKAGWGENMSYLTSLIHAFGGRWFDEQWQPQLNSIEWRRAITFYIDLIKKFGPPNSTRNGFTENLALFAQGHCAIWIDATVAAGFLFNPKHSIVYKHLGVAPAPKAAIKSNWLWAWSLAIPASSKYKKEAKKFITWATNKHYIKRVAEQYGWVSIPPGTRKSTYQSQAYLQVAPFAKLVLNAIESADIVQPSSKPTPYMGIQYVGIPEFAALGTYVGQVIVDVVEGNKKVDDALNSAQQYAYRQMRESGYIH